MSQADKTHTTIVSDRPAGSAAEAPLQTKKVGRRAKKVGRRELLRSGGAAALAIGGAAMVPFAAKAAEQPTRQDEALRDLWRQRTEAWLKAHAFQNRFDEAEFAICEGIKAVPRPWEFEGSIELTKWDKGPQRCFEVRRTSWGSERRLSEYPEAKCMDEARRLSKERQAQEEGARQRAERSLRRKYRLAALKNENDALHKAAHTIEKGIAKAPFVGALRAAVKMALNFVGQSDHPDEDPDTGFSADDNDQLALRMVYRELVKQCGYDPCAEWYATKGI